MHGPFQGKGGFTYMMGNKARSVIYTGVTADIHQRVWQHRFGEGSGFTKEYFCTDLMWYEAYDKIESAIAREKQLKNWKREWKLALMKKMNPELEDLAADWFDDATKRFHHPGLAPIHDHTNSPPHLTTPTDRSEVPGQARHDGTYKTASTITHSNHEILSYLCPLSHLASCCRAILLHLHRPHRI